MPTSFTGMSHYCLVGSDWPEHGRGRKVDRWGRRQFCVVGRAFLHLGDLPRQAGPEHRLIFLVDEVGQFIGSDTHGCSTCKPSPEDLGTICQGRAWVVVTSQEDIDAVLGEIKTSTANDFSKIQGRFKTRLSLSSANVDEVIQERLLAKRPEVVEALQQVFQTKGDILKNQLTFTDCGMTFRPYRDGADFVKNYPFAPYQFQLVQRIFEAIRKAGATGLHLSRGNVLSSMPFNRLASRWRTRRSRSWCRCTPFIRRLRASWTRRSSAPSTRPGIIPAWNPSTCDCCRCSF